MRRALRASLCFVLIFIALYGHAQVINADYNSLANTVEVKYFDVNNHLQVLWSGVGTGWKVSNMSNLFGAPVRSIDTRLTESFDPTINAVELYYVAQNQDLVQMSYYSGSWHFQDLTTLVGTPPNFPSTLMSSFDPVQNASELYFDDRTAHIQRLFSVAASPWQIQDLTAVTSAPAANPGVQFAGLFNPVANTMEVYYVNSTNSHVMQLYFTAGTGWHVQDLTFNTGGTVPAAGSNISGIHDPVFNNQELYFVDANNHLQQLYSSSTGWHAQDLTLAGAGPLAKFGSVKSIYNPLTQTVDVYFYDVQFGHLRRAFFANGWHSQDVTNLAGAAAPDNSAVLEATYDPIFSTLEVYYVTVLSNRHVQQVYFDGTTWHYQDITAAANAPAVQ